MSTLAIMFTMTTYGTWLRGDARGWVENSITFPRDPPLEAADRARMLHTPYRFPTSDLLPTAQAILTSLTTRLSLTIHALTLNEWHSHFLIAPTNHDIPTIAKCAKDAARYHLRPNRPIWTDGYDKRFCFDLPTLLARQRYIERHNTTRHWPPNPFPTLITPFPNLPQNLPSGQ